MKLQNIKCKALSRRGIATLEAGLVIAVFLPLMLAGFGILEYLRIQGKLDSLVQHYAADSTLKVLNLHTDQAGYLVRARDHIPGPDHAEYANQNIGTIGAQVELAYYKEIESIVARMQSDFKRQNICQANSCRDSEYKVSFLPADLKINMRDGDVVGLRYPDFVLPPLARNVFATEFMNSNLDTTGMGSSDVFKRFLIELKNIKQQISKLGEQLSRATSPRSRTALRAQIADLKAQKMKLLNDSFWNSLSFSEFEIKALPVPGSSNGAVHNFFERGALNAGQDGGPPIAFQMFQYATEASGAGEQFHAAPPSAIFGSRENQFYGDWLGETFGAVNPKPDDPIISNDPAGALEVAQRPRGFIRIAPIFGVSAKLDISDTLAAKLARLAQMGSSASSSGKVILSAYAIATPRKQF